MSKREKPHGAVIERFMRHHYGASGFVKKEKHMIKPTIGRVVWFWQFAGQEQPYTGLVCYVHNDALVNLAVFEVVGHFEFPQGWAF